MIQDVMIDALVDCLRMLPFLFGAFLLMEVLEHGASHKMNKILSKAGFAGPAAGAALGCVPQCGFSVIAANLYSGSVITLGTLLAVFIATSDEAILIFLSNPGQGMEILKLLSAKIAIALIAGYSIDFAQVKTNIKKKNMEDICVECGCEEQHGVLRPALYHTFKIWIFLLAFTGILNLAIQVLGMETISELLLTDTIFQPLLAALIGLIPNCASSVILTQLYLNGVISFSAIIAGLCTGAGLGLVVLFKMNGDKKENIKILGILYGISAAAGILLQLAGL